MTDSKSYRTDELKLPKELNFNYQGDSFNSSSQNSQEQTSRSNKANFSNIITSTDLTLLNNPSICFEHQRQMEAFCWTDKQALCIDCLLTSQSHKNHEILNIDKSLEKEGYLIGQVQDKLSQNKAKIHKHQNYITKFKQDLEKFAVEQTTQINSFFDNLRDIIERRYENVKQMMKETVDSKSKWAIDNEQLLKDILTNISSSDFQILSVQLSVHNKVDQLLQQIEKENQALQINDRADNLNKRINQQVLEEFDFEKEINLVTTKITNLQYTYCDTIKSQKGSISCQRTQNQLKTSQSQQRYTVMNKPNHNLSQRQLSNTSVQSSRSSVHKEKSRNNNNQFAINNVKPAQINTHQPKINSSFRVINKDSRNKQNLQQSFTKDQVKKPSLDRSAFLVKSQLYNTQSISLKQKQFQVNHKRTFSKQGQQTKTSRISKKDCITPITQNKEKLKYDFSTRNINSSNAQQKRKTAVIDDLSFVNECKNLKAKQDIIRQSVNTSFSRIYMDAVNNSVSESDNEDTSPFNQLALQVRERQNSVVQITTSFRPMATANQLSMRRGTEDHINVTDDFIYLVDQDQKQPFLQTEPSMIIDSRRSRMEYPTANSQAQYFLRAPSLKEKRHNLKVEKKNSISHQLSQEQWQNKQLQNVESIAKQSKKNQNRDNSQLISQRGDSLNNTLKAQMNLDHSIESITFGSLTQRFYEQGVFQNQDLQINESIGEQEVNITQNFSESMNAQDLKNSLMFQHQPYHTSSLGVFGKQNDDKTLSLQILNLNLNDCVIERLEISDILFHNITDYIYNTCCQGVYQFHNKCTPLMFIAFTNESKYGQSSIAIYSYNFELEEWNLLPEIKLCNLVDFKLAVHEYQLYLIGGSQDGKPTNKIYCFDIQNHTWTSLNPMNSCRSELTLASCPDGIIAIGGFDGDKVLKSCEVYSPITEEWEQIQDLTIERKNAGAIYFEKKLYVVGGNSQSGKVQRSIELYHQENDAWEIIGEISEDINSTSVNQVSIQL